MIRLLTSFEERCLSCADKFLPFAAPTLRRHRRVLRYIAAGGTAAAVDLGLLYVLTDWLGIYYLFSSVLAFLVAFCVSFVLQKFWTFGERTQKGMHAQAALYFVITGGNVAVNAGLMYFFVDVVGFWYLFAQIVAGATIACYSFALYRLFVFKNAPDLHETSSYNPEGR